RRCRANSREDVGSTSVSAKRVRNEAARIEPPTIRSRNIEMIHAALLVMASSSIGLQGAAAQGATAGPKAIIELVDTLPVPPAEGRFDHLAFDLVRRRLYVTEVQKSFVHAFELDRRAPLA